MDIGNGCKTTFSEKTPVNGGNKMIYEISYSPTALRDLDNVWDDVFGVSKDLDTADNYVNGILNKIKEMENRPKTGIPLYYDDIFTGVYFVVFKKYNAFYIIKGKQILVERVLNGKSDYLKKVLDNL
jgi:plasmid stabilization system protein ParE